MAFVFEAGMPEVDNLRSCQYHISLYAVGELGTALHVVFI